MNIWLLKSNQKVTILFSGMRKKIAKRLRIALMDWKMLGSKSINLTALINKLKKWTIQAAIRPIKIRTHQLFAFLAQVWDPMSSNTWNKIHTNSNSVSFLSQTAFHNKIFLNTTQTLFWQKRTNYIGLPNFWNWRSI